MLKEHSFLAKQLYLIEQRSIRRADVCLVDTEENAHYYARLFSVPIDKFKAIPLSIDEECFLPANSEFVSDPLRVLFAGTMVPLQGIPYICETIQSLSDNNEFSFVIIGDGQDSRFVEKLSQNLKHSNANVSFDWKRNWVNSKELREEIQKADVCLGIFGNNDKSNRVWPFKNYLYMACGKCVITRSSSSAARLKVLEPKSAFRTIDIDQSNALAACLLELQTNRHLVKDYSANSHKFFEKHLSKDVTSKALHYLLR